MMNDSRGEVPQMGRIVKWEMTLSLCSEGYAIKLSGKRKHITGSNYIMKYVE